MVSNRVRKVVVAGIFSALVMVLGISQLGFIPLPMGAITILQVPVIICAILEGPLAGCFTGLLFGIFSIVQAGIASSTPVDLAFLNYPFIAIVPRMLIGPGAYLVYASIAGSKTSPIRETTAVLLGAVAGSLINTVLVLSALALLVPEITWQLAATVAAFNGTVEAGFSAAISLAVVLAWKHIPRGGSRSRLSKTGD
ncbi:MAG: ECF transporter S component [Treponema sp.]|jgi:uncharacterized membrane protein|nr:ECF transporter S component [Treponema sp.]